MGEDNGEIEMIKIILGILVAPFVGAAGIKMALDMNRPRRGGRRRRWRR